MTMFRAWSPSTHVARYFTHLLHIGLLGLFPSTASLDAVCSVFHVLAAPLPSQSYCFMCSKSEANATNSSVFERAGGGDLARCRQPRKAKQWKTFTLIAICRIWTHHVGHFFLTVGVFCVPSWACFSYTLPNFMHILRLVRERENEICSLFVTVGPLCLLIDCRPKRPNCDK